MLLKEIQSLSLDANVVSEGGDGVEVADDDDDLLKAAEELGMDLTGVRADGGGAADEQEEQVVKEGEGGTDGAKAEEAETEEAEAK